MLRLVLIFVFCSLVCGDSENTYYDIEDLEAYFEDFIRTYDKVYESKQEKERRLRIFEENLKIINERNKNEPYAEHGINKFADLTIEEMDMYKGLLRPSGDNLQGYCNVLTDADIKLSGEAPAAFDWREHKVVTRVKDQGSCGACYAFSTIANIESQYAIKNKRLVEFSEQQLVDCSSRNLACNGGFMTYSMSDIIDSKGLATEQQYPYSEYHQRCVFNNSMAAIKLKGCNNYRLVNENILKEVLFKTGPLAIGINAADVMSYKNNILDNCIGGDPDHAVLLVGYGTERNVDYWIIKNSWGTLWGENGYFRIVRGKNSCGLMNELTASAILD